MKDSEKIWKIYFGGRAGVVGIKLNERQSCVKLFYDNRSKSIIRNALGFPKALRAYKKALDLSSRNISTPQMLGWAQNKRFGLVLIITELAQDAIQTDTWLKKNKVTDGFVQAFALFIRNMHDVGVRHLDLSPRNILVRADDKKKNYKFYILDYEDARFYKKLPYEKRLLDLHHLNERAIALVPKEIRQNFLKHYLWKNSKEYSKWEKALIHIMMKKPSKYTKEYIDLNYR